MSRLLEGVRVLESASLFNGDAVGASLADVGADVIKVESPGRGDYLRWFLGQIHPGHSPAHLQINKNKRSLTLDLRQDVGREVFWRLLATADVFIDGNVSGVCEKLGIGYEDQRAHKPDIVYCHYSGYGAEGPYRNIPTHGQMMDALVGAHPREMGDDGFVKPGQHAGPMSGMDSGGEGTAAGAVHAAFHIAAALAARARTGEGAFIDVAGPDGVIAQAWISATYTLNDHRIVDRTTMPAMDRGVSTGAKYQFYQCRDGKIILFCCIEPQFWHNFCRAVDREDLLDTVGGNAGNGLVDFGGGDEDLRRELQHIFTTKDLAEWVDIAAEHDIAMGPAPRSILEASEDPHVRARGVIHVRDLPGVGEFTYIGEAGRVRGQPYEVRRAAPDLGEHTGEILKELGYGWAQIAELEELKVVSCPGEEPR